MNCLTCIKLSKNNIVEKGLNNEPYKYKCGANRFPSLKSTNELGKSFNDGKNEYYTETQLCSFISKNKHKVCFYKYSISNSNIISIIAISLSFVYFVFSYNQNKANINLLKNRVTNDSIYFANKIKILKDSTAILQSKIDSNIKLINTNIQGITKNIVHLADSAKYKYDSNK